MEKEQVSQAKAGSSFKAKITNLRNAINMRPTESQLKLQCPNCKSYKVGDQRHNKSKMFVVGIIGVVFGLIIPIFGWFLLLPGGILAMLISIFIPNRNRARCSSCSYEFDIIETEKLL